MQDLQESELRVTHIIEQISQMSSAQGAGIANINTVTANQHNSTLVE